MQEIEGWHGGKILAFVDGVEFEWAAQQQAHNVASLPIVTPHVAIMPDVHAGIGATVGSVIPTKDAIIPSAVGVDIGCGMIAAKTELSADQLGDLSVLRARIEALIPIGNGPGGGWGGHGGVPSDVKAKWQHLESGYAKMIEQYPHLKDVAALDQLGSLGGGNHFIEVSVDLEGCVWIVLHSGSRAIGNHIARIFIDKAKANAEARKIALPDKALAWLEAGDPDFDAYIQHMLWAQTFASRNREMMLDYVAVALDVHVGAFKLDQCINCHHNFASFEKHFGQELWITRKGAVRVPLGEFGIIPGSMGALTYIVKGKGSALAFDSCSHGAGRRMSRSAAKAQYNENDLIDATQGVECRKDRAVVDEIPYAYKDIGAVIAAQSDLVETVTTVKQVLCIKG